MTKYKFPKTLDTQVGVKEVYCEEYKLSPKLSMLKNKIDRINTSLDIESFYGKVKGLEDKSFHIPDNDLIWYKGLVFKGEDNDIHKGFHIISRLKEGYYFSSVIDGIYDEYGEDSDHHEIISLDEAIALILSEHKTIDVKELMNLIYKFEKPNKWQCECPRDYIE